MQHLAANFNNILEKNRLPQVNVKQGETMMGIISSFQRHYVDPNKTDLNIHMHTFGGTAVTVVMEAFRKYYLVVEKEAVKLQTEPENEEISEQEQSREEQSRIVKHPHHHRWMSTKLLVHQEHLQRQRLVQQHLKVPSTQ